MNKELVIVTKDGFKFIYKGERAEQVSNVWSDECGLVHFGDGRLIIPMDNLSYYWMNEVE
ncbi:hypothetical protein [Clostridium sp.]|uniref:hypothetical protein n=1 Tax=Clostridium sp. TaxID=1506 RepID=UPI00260DB1B6|nr:hypothetical protein [Clostridium sp.]